MKLKTPPTEANAVEEILSEEMTLEKAIAEISAGNAREAAAAIVHSAVAEECANRGNKLAQIRIRMAEIAEELAGAGDYDHKSKNEVILRVVTSLLRLSKDAVRGQVARDMDDIPF